MTEERERKQFDVKLGALTLLAEGEGDGTWVDLPLFKKWMSACEGKLPKGASANLYVELSGWGESRSDYGVELTFYATSEETKEAHAQRLEKLDSAKAKAEERKKKRRAEKARADALAERALFEKLKKKYEP